MEAHHRCRAIWHEPIAIPGEVNNALLVVTAATPDQVRTRTVLPGGGGTESETAGAVPCSPAATDTGLELRTEPEEQERESQ